MKVNPIYTPVTGERVFSVHPIIEAYPAANWRRRLNNFTGRTLTHSALNAEQKWRSGRIAAIGQLVSPGVISGLEAEISAKGDLSEIDLPEIRMHISPGAALTAGGEIMTLTRPVNVAWQDLFVYVHYAYNEEDSADGSGSGKDAASLPTLAELVKKKVSIPRAAILVLQPVYTEINVLRDKEDPCEVDPADYAFENWQLVDASRPVLYTWPEDWLPLPAEWSPSDATDSKDVQWRNRMAFNIFFKERENDIQQLHPWEHCGVPIAMIGLRVDWKPEFVDRNAVLRAGGKRRRTASIVPDIGNRFLWQAQFQQFNEQLAELVTQAAAEENVIKKAEKAFRYLPPVGIMPQDFMEPRAGTQDFFPFNYHVEAIAIPHEQLDVAVRDSAPLLPFDLQTPDRVQVLVPVPQVYYEPGLLKIEEVDVEFDETIRRFSQQRDEWLGRRLEVRRKASALYQAIKGEPLKFAAYDPDAVDNLELASPFEKAVIEIGDTWRYFKGDVEPAGEWKTDAFDDGDWNAGTTTIGYGLGHLETELDDMEGFYKSIFCRRSFELEKDELKNKYKLLVTTNGGFVIYINGVEFERSKLHYKLFKSPFLRPRRSIPHEFDLSEIMGTLKAGPNLIAIQIYNHEIDSPFFEFSTRLLSKTFIEDIDEEGYGTVLEKGADDVAVVDDAYEPEYQVKALIELKDYLGTNTKLSDQEIEDFDENGLQEFTRMLQERVDSANDKIDFGFIRMQTDIYRVRQSVLGNVEATKLATSPILAMIAQGDTAYATKQELADYLKSLKGNPGESSNPGSNPPNPEKPSGEGGSSSASESGTSAITAGSSGMRSNIFLSGEMQDSVKPSSGGTHRGSNPDLLTAGSAHIKFPDQPGTFSPKAALRQASWGSGQLFVKTTPGKKDIQEQTPIIGATETFRNATVAQRLDQPIATGAKFASVATKAGIVQNIIDAEITFGDDIKIPGFRKETGEEESLPLSKIIADKLVGKIMDGSYDKNKVDDDGVTLEDESAYFNAGVRAMENTSAILRIFEGRVHAYKMALAKCEQTITELDSLLRKADGRLKTIADELAEARHDVTVARALKAEEQARIDAINERRDNIIAEHVPFLVFRRPRLIESRIDAPVITLNPDLSEAPLPVCNVDESETPQEISAMMDIVREAPLRWLTISQNIIQRLNRLIDLRVAIRSAKIRVTAKSIRHPLLDINYDSLDLFSQGIGKALSVSHQYVMVQRQKTTAMNLAALTNLGWNETATRAKDLLSLGDVIDGNHGRVGASRTAAEELERIARLATCLYLRFGQVLPSIRLDWAERLSQFDAPLNLRNLYNLPRWGELEYIERQEMQALADWLYQRVDAVQSEAVGLIGDLIRICILLASQAPVNKIIAGRIPEPATIGVGSKIDISAELARVRIGQNVMVQSGGRTVARATVEDIVGGQVSARVLTTLTETVSLEKDAKVQIGEPRSIGGNQIVSIQPGFVSTAGMAIFRS